MRWQVSQGGTGWIETSFTGTTLTLPAAPYLADGLAVRAVATNDAGEVFSDAAVLTVEALAPEVLTAPEPVTVDEGQDATFSVEVSGDPEPTIQWQTSTDGAAWTDVDGETAESITFADAGTELDGLLVRALVENPGGTVTTDGVVLGVEAVVIPAPVVPGVPVLTPQAPDRPGHRGGRGGTRRAVAGTDRHRRGRPRPPRRPARGRWWSRHRGVASAGHHPLTAHAPRRRVILGWPAVGVSGTGTARGRRRPVR